MPPPRPGPPRRPATRNAGFARVATGKADAAGPTSQQITRMERELAALQTQVKSVEESYGIDNLHLTFARGYLGKLLANARIVRRLSQHRPEYLTEFQRLAEIDSLGGLHAPSAE